MSHVVYIVGTVLPQPLMGDDFKPNLSILGCFNDIQDAKDAVGANAMMVFNNKGTTLTIYKVDLGQNIHYTYHESDLEGARARLQNERNAAPTVTHGDPPAPQKSDDSPPQDAKGHNAIQVPKDTTDDFVET
jgi:hypothetical protein